MDSPTDDQIAFEKALHFVVKAARLQRLDANHVADCLCLELGMTMLVSEFGKEGVTADRLHLMAMAGKNAMLDALDGMLKPTLTN